MDTLIKKIIVILLLTFTLVGCKKYPEGGRISGWQGVEGKISGQYNIRELMVNNIDSTSSFVGNPCYCSSSYKVSFLKDEISGRTSRIIKSDCGTFPENSWKVSDNRKQLIITSVNTISRGELYPLIINQDITITWDIQRLEKDDLWLKTNLNGKEYHLKLTYQH